MVADASRVLRTELRGTIQHIAMRGGGDNRGQPVGFGDMECGAKDIADNPKDCMYYLYYFISVDGEGEGVVCNPSMMRTDMYEALYS